MNYTDIYIYITSVLGFIIPFITVSWAITVWLHPPTYSPVTSSSPSFSAHGIERVIHRIARHQVSYVPMGGSPRMSSMEMAIKLGIYDTHMRTMVLEYKNQHLPL